MYKSFTASDYKKLLKLPADYQVDGFLCLGSYKKPENNEFLKGAFTNKGLNPEYENLTDFLNEVLVFKVNGKRYWFVVSYGGAYLSEILHFACLFGSKKTILIGSCGGLYEEGKSGDIVIPDYSFGNESTTRMYDPNGKKNKHYSDLNLSKSLQDRVNKDLTILEGPTMTCQAMLAESWEDVQRWSKEGYFGVEMEASTIFAVSKHFNVPAASMLIITDNLIKEESVLHENYQQEREFRHKVREHIFEVAIDELLAN